MNAQLFSGLLPLLLLAGTAVILLLQVIVRRHLGLAVGITLAGLLAAFLACLRPGVAGPAPLTALFVFDSFAAYAVALLVAAAAAVAAMSWGYLRRTSERPEEFFLLLVLATLGAAAMVMSRHLASLFLGLELMSISLYALIAFVPERRLSLEAGAKYLVLASSASAFLLFGMALVYFETGTLAYVQLAGLLGSMGFEPVLTCGLGLMVVFFGFKLALVPFHLWTPDVYQGAPAPVTALVATVSKGATAVALLRLFLQLGLVGHPWWALVFAILSGGSMLAGNLLALLQTNVKRLLAYSSIAHLGYLLLAALAGGPSAGAAVAFYLVAYILTILGAFWVLAALSSEGREPEELEHLRGLGRRRPWLAGTLTFMLLSLAGIPLTAGFIGKYLVLGAGVGSLQWILVFLLVTTSVVGLYYYLRVIVALYMRPPTMDRPTPVDEALRAPWPAALGLTLLVGLLVWLGVYPGPLLDWLNAAAAGLF